MFDVGRVQGEIGCSDGDPILAVGQIVEGEVLVGRPVTRAGGEFDSGPVRMVENNAEGVRVHIVGQTGNCDRKGCDHAVLRRRNDHDGWNAIDDDRRVVDLPISGRQGRGRSRVKL